MLHVLIFCVFLHQQNKNKITQLKQRRHSLIRMGQQNIQH